MAMSGFLDGMRGEVTDIGAVGRVRRVMEGQEAVENRQRAEKAYEREAQAEAAALNRSARQRHEIWMFGETTEQRQQREAEQAEWKQARITELETELRRLDPVRFGVQRSREAQAPRAAETLRRAREVGGNEFMAEQVRRFDERRGREGDLRRARREADIERAAAAGWITRGTGYITSAH